MTTHDLPIKDLKLLTDVVTEEELKEYQAKLSADINLVTDAKIKEALRHLIDDAPEAFDTLKEIAEWLINHGKKAKDLVDRVFELSNNNSSICYNYRTRSIL